MLSEPLVQHQPRHQLGKYLVGERDLIHRLVVRTDLDVVPAPERHRKRSPIQPRNRSASAREVAGS